MIDSAIKRVVAFDFGMKRIGVATGQSLTGTGTPQPEVAARDGQPDWEVLTRMIAQWEPHLLLVGEPKNMDGTDSDMTLRARKFSKRLHGRTGLPVQLVDERLTSFDAKQLVRERYGQQDFGKFAVDSIAAVLILEAWFSDAQETS